MTVVARPGRPENDWPRPRECRCNAAMRITSETISDGIREQLFTIGDIPGVLWTPAGSSGPRPLVLIGHGGGQHKKGWEVVSRAFPYVTTCGFAVAAIDAPGTGDRPEHPEIRRLVALIQEREAAGESFWLSPEWPALNETVAAQLIPDWQTALDALQKLDHVGDSHPVGYYGLSQGGEMGIRLVAAEPRITAAVLGLVGSDWLIDTAARITIPVEFVLQWDDDSNPRDSVMKLFDALGSAEKTLHANPGSHFRVPSFEIDSSIQFFARHLGSAGTATDS
ncbi:dienelactone hydrolase family protein [Nonomuraea phyllanthi]|uniref:dienelactone hydrolase family protein n=1 Tax=Nonomuraea phyllanthi TaxID=2219224 RepID=UPI001D136C50|nr:alpha/beta fold hydrolase [Nonomuraea phyllanthi]